MVVAIIGRFEFKKFITADDCNCISKISFSIGIELKKGWGDYHYIMLKHKVVYIKSSVKFLF
jgi:hypothetical protein